MPLTVSPAQASENTLFVIHEWLTIRPDKQGFAPYSLQYDDPDVGVRTNRLKEMDGVRGPASKGAAGLFSWPESSRKLSSSAEVYPYESGLFVCTSYLFRSNSPTSDTGVMK